MLISATKHSSCILRINRKSTIKSQYESTSITQHWLLNDLWHEVAKQYRTHLSPTAYRQCEDGNPGTVVARHKDSYSAINESSSSLLYPKAFDVTSQYRDALQLQHKCRFRVMSRTGISRSRTFINRKLFWDKPQEGKTMFAFSLFIVVKALLVLL